MVEANVNVNLEDILCFSEHWLCSEEIPLFNIENYNLVSSYSRTVAKNGGTVIYARKNLLCKKLEVSQFSSEIHCEMCAVTIKEFNVIIVCVYRSPSGDFKIFCDQLEQSLIWFSRLGLEIILCGDFNVDIRHSSSASTALTSLIQSFNLHCANMEPTRLDSCLDNIITGLNTDQYSILVTDLGLSDHLALKFQFLIKKCEINTVGRKTHTFRRPITPQGICELKSLLTNVSWHSMLTYDNSNDNFACFFETFLLFFQQCFPKKLVKQSNSFKQSLKWFTPELSEIRSQVIQLRKKYIHTGNVEDKNTWRQLKSSYNNLIIQAKRNFNSNVIGNATNQNKAAWQVINKEIGHSRDVPDLPFTSDNLNKYFIDSIADLVSNLDPTPSTALPLLCKFPASVSPFKWKWVTEYEIRQIIKNLKYSKCTDVYGLSVNLIKELVNIIDKPLALIINSCFQSGIFPKALKISKTIPIHKKGDKTLPSNYRPISLIPVFGKIFEKAIKIQVYQHFQVNNLFSPSQFGFRKGYSTTSAVMSAIDQILDAFLHKSSIAITACDLTKAFDCVAHPILLQKLQYYGFNNLELQLFESYLSDRSQCVFINNNLSSPLRLNYGVPQGSVLGPLLFLIIINDLPSNVSCKSILYADDTTFIYKINNLINNSPTANLLLEARYWFSANGLVLNNEKTQSQVFSLSSTSKSSDTVKLLGFELDHKLTWEPHVVGILRKSSKAVYMLRKLQHRIPKEYLIQVYYALFHCHINYGIELWGHSPHTYSLFRMQKKAVRLISFSHPRDHCKPLFSKLQIMSLYSLYIYKSLCNVKDNLSSLEKRSNFHNHFTRNSDALDIPYCRIAKYSNSFNILKIRLFNRLPPEARQVSAPKFKKVVRDWLTRKAFYSINEFFDCEIECSFTDVPV
jgi:hypothetical protein